MSTRVTFHKGRVALYAVLKALGIGPEDEVVIPGYTCVVVPNAILHLGATPVYADIDPQTFNTPPETIEARISQRTRAIVIQHTYGIPAYPKAIRDLADKHHLPVLEDCAHTMHSKWEGRLVGSFGEAAIYSSQWSKPIATGLGGWAIVNNPTLLSRLLEVREDFEACNLAHDILLMMQYRMFIATRHLQLYWTAQKLYRALGRLGIGAAATHRAEILATRPPHYERKMSPWQERMLREQLRRSAAIDEHRRYITTVYDRSLSEHGVPPFAPPPESDCVLLRYPIRVADKSGVLDAARKRRLEIGDWFNSPIHPKQDDWEACGYHLGSCPNAEDAARHVINLPTHDLIDEREAERIVEFVAPFCAMTVP